MLNKQQIIEDLLGLWKLPEITSLELKEFAIQEFPDLYWRQTEVSEFLQSTDLPFVDNSIYRTYTLQNGKFYYSQTENKYYRIKDMNKQHIYNVLNKHYGNFSINKLLHNDPVLLNLMIAFLNEKS